MVMKRGTGLLMVWVDIPTEKEEGFKQWFSQEHRREFLTIPGVVNAGLYVALGGSPKYLSCYELDGPEVVETEPFQKWDNSNSRRMSPRTVGTNMICNVYRQAYPRKLHVLVYRRT